MNSAVSDMLCCGIEWVFLPQFMIVAVTCRFWCSIAIKHVATIVVCYICFSCTWGPLLY